MPFSEKPKVFFGSSTEGLPIATGIIENLKGDIEATSWENAFPLADTTINSLIVSLNKNNFAVFVLSADDMTKIKGSNVLTPRDNVLFEAGLAIGKYGKLNCFLVTPNNLKDFHVATDLLGITRATFDTTALAIDAISATNKCSEDIRKTIKESKWNTLKLDITSGADTYNPDTLDYKNKLLIRFLNREKFAIRIELKEANLYTYTIDPFNKIFGGRKYYDPVFIESKNKQEFYRQIDTVKPNEPKEFWIPIDPTISRAELNESLKINSAGKLSIVCELLIEEEVKFFKTINF